MANIVVLIGRLTKDPELRYIQGSGTATVSFTLAVDKGLSKDKKAEFESQNKPTADFIRIVAWGKLAETIANYTVKGRLVGVQGHINTGSYDGKDGKQVFTTDVVASNIEFLEWGDKKKETINDIPDGFQPSNNSDIPF